jgi:16S rRNA (guanine527-N7)-methyltransferase
MGAMWIPPWAAGGRPELVTVARPNTLKRESPGSDVRLESRTIEASAHLLGVELSTAQLEQLQRFVRLLLKWNLTHNLTAITRADQILSHHLLDSLSVAPELAAPGRLRVLDAGAGAGFPGIPLAIALPRHHFTLVEAVAKKCAFMIQARLELGLDNVEILNRRLEKLRGELFDVIVSRALASLADFVRLTRHLLAPGGRWIAMKGLLPADELRELPHDVAVARTLALRVPLLDEARHLVVLQPN